MYRLLEDLTDACHVALEWLEKHLEQCGDYDPELVTLIPLLQGAFHQGRKQRNHLKTSRKGDSQQEAKVSIAKQSIHRVPKLPAKQERSRLHSFRGSKRHGTALLRSKGVG